MNNEVVRTPAKYRLQARSTGSKTYNSLTSSEVGNHSLSIKQHRDFLHFFKESKRVFLPYKIERTLKSLELDRVPWTWWPSLANVVADAQTADDPTVLTERLKGVVTHLDYFSERGLHIMSRPDQIKRAFFKSGYAKVNKTSLPEFTLELARRTDLIARDLLVHRLQNNKKISAPAVRLMQIREQFQITSFNHKYPYLSSESARQAYLRRTSARDFDCTHRVTETAIFCKEDLGWIGRIFYITAPPHFHPVPVSGRMNPRWLQVGRPSPIQAHQWLMTVIRKTYKKARSQSIGFIGHRITEAHQSSGVHVNLILHFACDETARQFELMLNKIYHQCLGEEFNNENAGTQTRIGARASEPIKTRILFDAEDTLQGAHYVTKSITQNARLYLHKSGKHGPLPGSHFGDCQPNDLHAHAGDHDGQFANDLIDRMYCQLWGIQQFSEVGTNRNQFGWSALRHITSDEIETSQHMNLLSMPLMAAWQAANPSHRSYRSFLRLTHPLTPKSKRVPIWFDDMEGSEHFQTFHSSAYTSTEHPDSTGQTFFPVSLTEAYLIQGQSCILLLTCKCVGRLVFKRTKIDHHNQEPYVPKVPPD